jgi:hypothetical protein
VPDVTPGRLPAPDYAACVVSVLRPDGTVAGAGMLLPGRRVLTCAHVVNEALGRDLDTE